VPVLLESLIQQLPSDTSERVQKARDRFNNRIREALRRETRLSFRRRADERDSQRQENIGVPIAVVPGLPSALHSVERRSIEDKHQLAALLSPYRQILLGLRDNGSLATQKLVPALIGAPLASGLLDGREQSIAAVTAYADFLLGRLTEFDLTKFILDVDEDVLGVYSYRVSSYFDDPNPRIELYWGIIGLVARDLGVEIEDLTCVVLTHELAHAYTHVGSDADDHFWPSGKFAESAKVLKEGLAQYYTALVCGRAEKWAPRAFAAYEKLLPKQPDIYCAHCEWVAEPEWVRLAMLEIRRSSAPGSIERFKECLERAFERLGATGTTDE